MVEQRIQFHEHLLDVLRDYGSVLNTENGWIWYPFGTQPAKITPANRDNVVHLYFQPPESLQITYPCLIYELKDIRKVTADNRTYAKFRSYKLIYITWWPDSDVVDRIVDLPFCSLDGAPYKADNLYHYTYTMYY